MYDGNWKDLWLFIIKLQLKLHFNHNHYSEQADKVVYGMTQLEEDAACTVDSFYCGGILKTLNIFIMLLKQTYDDTSREDTAMTKLKVLQQKNCEFMSFYSEFLGLTDELDWNKSAKVAALWRAISDEVCKQLIRKMILKNLNKFIMLC